MERTASRLGKDVQPSIHWSLFAIKTEAVVRYVLLRTRLSMHQ